MVRSALVVLMIDGQYAIDAATGNGQWRRRLGQARLR